VWLLGGGFGSVVAVRRFCFCVWGRMDLLSGCWVEKIGEEEKRRLGFGEKGSAAGLWGLFSGLEMRAAARRDERKGRGAPS